MDSFTRNFVRFAFRPPMFTFAILSNIAVTVLSSDQRGLWYTPLTLLILVMTIVYTKERYGWNSASKHRNQA
jgi:hypothetical protein